MIAAKLRLVLLLVSAGRFEPRRRPQTARDELPIRPLLHVLALWSLLGIGGLFIAIFGLQLYAFFSLGTALDPATRIAMAFMGVSGPICLWSALCFWRKLRQ